MADKATFAIGNRDYSFPESFRLGDPVLVQEVTGMEFPDFAEALDDPQRRKSPVILAGLVAVAVWQGNPSWKRDRVRRFVEELDMDALNFPEAEQATPEQEDKQDPPAQAA